MISTRNLKYFAQTFFSLIFCLLQASCFKSPSVTQSGPGTCVEQAYCSSTINYGSGVSVTGTANYDRCTSGAAALQCDTGNIQTNPIRFAEVTVYNSASGAQLNCGDTDATGNFNISVPANTPLRVTVRSRGYNSTVRASVLDTPYAGCTPHQVSTTASGASSGAINSTPTLAELRGTFNQSAGIVGGAFNILDVIVTTNQRLAANVSGYSSAPKMYAFWKAGVDPYPAYYGGNSSISFYLVGTSQLFILGGSNGDTNSSDTDHYDNAIIAHEYGHFIEDIFARNDSPGGSHNGNAIIDPRLAWGEGWANFFSSFSRNDVTYQDSIGNNPSGTNSYFINYDIETDLPSRDLAASIGEGNFREFAVTRTLWDGIDAANDGEAANVTFQTYWDELTGNYKNNGHFRNIGLFFETYLTDLGVNAALSAMFTIAQSRTVANTSTTYYAMPLSGATGTVDITTSATASGSFSSSNKFLNNHYYSFYHNGTYGKINMAGVSGAADLDLFVLAEDYTYGSSADILKASAIASTSDECVNLSGLGAGYYMVLVFADTSAGGNGTLTQYSLTPGGGSCP